MHAVYTHYYSLYALTQCVEFLGDVRPGAACTFCDRSRDEPRWARASLCGGVLVRGVATPTMRCPSCLAPSKALLVPPTIKGGKRTYSLREWTS